MIRIKMLTELVADESRPREKRERAAEILSLVAERLKFPVDHPRPGSTQSDIEHEVNVQKMLLEASELDLLWSQPENVLFRTVTANGGTYRVVMNKKFHGPQAYSEMPAPIPAKLKPAPQREPIVETTVPQEEKQYLTFDERFAPAEVARRVAKINAEAAELRCKREAENASRGFSI